jgi:uncharacterized protein (DUF2267 family)
MSMTGFEIFDRTVQKTNELLVAIEEEFNWQKRREQSYSALREVLHALRDRLRVDDSANFASQLPMLLQGVYYDGWDPSQVPVKMDKEEFLNRIQENFEYSLDGNIADVADVVLNKIFDSIDSDMAEDLKEVLPSDLSEILD